MFEVPHAKRVRRADLDRSDDSGSESGSAGYDEELQARLNAQIARSLGIAETYDDEPEHAAVKVPDPEPRVRRSDNTDSEGSSDEGEDIAANDNEDAGDEEFAFRLFSSAQPTQKVVLEEDAEPQGDGGLAAKRPLSFYMATNLTDQQKQRYSFAAVSGEDILARSKNRAWGLEMPWKVIKTSVICKRKPGESTMCVVEDETTKKKRRPSKKQRISLRKALKAKEEKKQAAAQKMAEKEEHIKDKKKRMNRLKKLRKRAKNKELKQAKGAGQEGDAGESGGESDGSE